MIHYIAHQQALIKNNICVAVLAFEEHDETLMQNTFSNFDYDTVVDLCVIQKDAALDASWDGENFNIKFYPSWILGEDLKWHCPISKPEGNFWWNEENQSWIEILDTNNAII